MWFVVSCLHKHLWRLWSVSDAFSPHGEDPLHSSPTPAWGPSHRRDYPWTSLMWMLTTSCSSLQTASEWVLSTECSPIGIDYSRLGPLWGHKSDRIPYGVTNPASKSLVWASLSPGPHKSCQEPALTWASQGVRTFLGCSSPAWVLPQAEARYLLHH